MSPPTGGRVANKPKDGIHSWGIRLISNALSGLLSIADIAPVPPRVGGDDIIIFFAQPYCLLCG